MIINTRVPRESTLLLLGELGFANHPREKLEMYGTRCGLTLLLKRISKRSCSQSAQCWLERNQLCREQYCARLHSDFSFNARSRCHSVIWPVPLRVNLISHAMTFKSDIHNKIICFPHRQPHQTLTAGC